MKPIHLCAQEVRDLSTREFVKGALVAMLLPRLKRAAQAFQKQHGLPDPGAPALVHDALHHLLALPPTLEGETVVVTLQGILRVITPQDLADCLIDLLALRGGALGLQLLGRFARLPEKK